MGQTSKIVKIENKQSEMECWVDLKDFRGNYQVFVHFTSDFKTWGETFAGTVNIQSDQQIGIKLPKNCLIRNYMFWNFKFVKI